MLIAQNEETGEEVLFSENLYCPRCNISLPVIEPRLFSFNSPHGACPDCTGLGTKLVLDPDLVMPNKRLTIAQGAIKPWTRIAGNQTAHLKLLEAVGRKHGFSIHQEVGQLTADDMKTILDGTGDDIYDVEGKSMVFPGILALLEEKYRQTDSEYVQKEIEGYMRVLICPACNGKRLNKTALGITIADKNLADIVELSLEEAAAFFESIKVKTPSKIKESKI